MGELATLTRLISPRQLPNSVDVCPNEAEICHESCEIEIGDEPGDEAAPLYRVFATLESRINKNVTITSKPMCPFVHGARAVLAGEFGTPRIPLSIETQTFYPSYLLITAT